MWAVAGCVHPQSLTIPQYTVPCLLQQDPMTHMTWRWQTALRPPAQSPLSTWDCSLILTLDLLSRSNLQMGSYQHHCMAPAQACWDAGHSYLGHAHPTAPLPVLGLDLFVLLPLTHPQRYSPSTKCPVALAYLIWWKKQDSFSEPEGRRRKNERISTQTLCSCAAEFKRNPQALSAERQICTSATAQDPCLIISYLNKCSSIRVGMLARHLGEDLGYNSSPDSQGEKACGLLCGRAIGYKEHLWLWVQDKQTLKKHSGWCVHITRPAPLAGEPKSRNHVLVVLSLPLPWYPDTSCIPR